MTVIHKSYMCENYQHGAPDTKENLSYQSSIHYIKLLAV